MTSRFLVAEFMTYDVTNEPVDFMISAIDIPKKFTP